MMGEQKNEPQLFNYAVNLEKRVRANHPLRRIKELIDFGFVREEVAHCYGQKGDESVAPEVILKIMFLLFFDNVASERELMKIIAERLDYLWFLGYGGEDEIPDHSVLSKARARWGKEVFEGLFVRTIAQCVRAGLVDGGKLHVDASLIEADASRESVIKGPPELIAALKHAYAARESKLGEGVTTPENYEAVNERMMSKSDPDAAMVSRRGHDSRPRYHHHRAIDDKEGVITAVETTPGSVTENRKLLALIEQHERTLAVRLRQWWEITNIWHPRQLCSLSGTRAYYPPGRCQQRTGSSPGPRDLPRERLYLRCAERYLSLSCGRSVTAAAGASGAPPHGV